MMRWYRSCDVYTDGSCLNNHQTGRRAAGIGIVFTDNSTYSDQSIPYDELGTNSPPTNQTAELQAMKKALELISMDVADDNHNKYVLYTDSKYAIDCILKFVPFWMEKYGMEPSDWRTASGHVVSNHELVYEIWYLYQGIDVLYDYSNWGTFKLKHVKAHVGNDHNEEADRLAKSAATRMMHRYY